MIIELSGWIGAGCILWAYFLVSTKRVIPESGYFHLFNLAGSFLLLVNAYAHNAFAFMILNIVWTIIALKSLLTR